MKKNYITCPFCKNKMGELARYCNECGTKLPPPQEPVDREEQARLEAFCGEEAHNIIITFCNAKFCLWCGKRLRPVN